MHIPSILGNVQQLQFDQRFPIGVGSVVRGFLSRYQVSGIARLLNSALHPDAYYLMRPLHPCYVPPRTCPRLEVRSG